MKSKLIKPKWLILFLTILLLITLSIILLFISPVIILKNNTNQLVYVYAMQNENGKEPTLEEMEKWKGILTIKPKHQIKLSLTLNNLFTGKIIRHSNGWRIGNQNTNTKIYNQAFITDKNTGTCSTTIIINENSFSLKTSNQSFCYKKLVPVTNQY